KPLSISPELGCSTQHCCPRRRMSFSTWSFPAINAQEVMALLHVFLPYPIGFLAGWIGYRWLKQAGLQSERFSPVVAAVVTAPLVAVAYYIIATTAFTGGHLGNAIYLIGMLFSPIMVVLVPLLAVYVGGGLQGRKLFGVALAGMAVVLVISEFVGLYF